MEINAERQQYMETVNFYLLQSICYAFASVCECFWLAEVRGHVSALFHHNGNKSLICSFTFDFDILWYFFATIFLFFSSVHFARYILLSLSFSLPLFILLLLPV